MHNIRIVYEIQGANATFIDVLSQTTPLVTLATFRRIFYRRHPDYVAYRVNFYFKHHDVEMGYPVKIEVNMDDDLLPKFFGQIHATILVDLHPSVLRQLQEIDNNEVFYEDRRRSVNTESQIWHDNRTLSVVSDNAFSDITSVSRNITRPLLENRRGSIPTSKLPKNPISPEEWFEKENSFQQLPKGQESISETTNKKLIIQRMIGSYFVRKFVKTHSWCKLEIPQSFLGKDFIEWIFLNVDGFRKRKQAQDFCTAFLKQNFIRDAIPGRRYSINSKESNFSENRIYQFINE